MPYVTSVELIAEERGIEKGIEQGIEQGSVTLLIRILTKLCGELPPEVQQEIQALSLEESQDLGEALLEFRSLTDLKKWLATDNKS